MISISVPGHLAYLVGEEVNPKWSFPEPYDKYDDRFDVYGSGRTFERSLLIMRFTSLVLHHMLNLGPTTTFHHYAVVATTDEHCVGRVQQLKNRPVIDLVLSRFESNEIA